MTTMTDPKSWATQINPTRLDANNGPTSQSRWKRPFSSDHLKIIRNPSSRNAETIRSRTKARPNCWRGSDLVDSVSWSAFLWASTSTTGYVDLKTIWMKQNCVKFRHWPFEALTIPRSRSKVKSDSQLANQENLEMSRFFLGRGLINRKLKLKIKISTKIEEQQIVSRSQLRYLWISVDFSTIDKTSTWK